MNSLRNRLRNATALALALLMGAANVHAGVPATEELVRLERAVQAVAENVCPIVVQVVVTRLIASSNPMDPQSERVSRSGFLYNTEGYVVSLGRVYESASRVQVRLGTKLHDADLVGVDETSTLSLLRVHLPQEWPLPPLPALSPTALKAGSLIITVGCTGADHAQVALGSIGAVDRQVGYGTDAVGGLWHLTQQSMASSAGSPVVDVHGNIVGIAAPIPALIRVPANLERLRRHVERQMRRLIATGAKRGRNQSTLHWLWGDGRGTASFALPMAQAQPIILKLMADSGKRKPWLGVQVIALDADLASRLGVSETGGALVLSVVDNGPAHSAGLQRWDVIERFGDTAIEDHFQLRGLVAARRADESVNVVVVRAKERVTLKVVLRPRAAATKGPLPESK